MRVRLKGLNKVSKCLSDGRRVVYYYAWKGGPRLSGEPGTPEFLASYQAAQAKRRAPASDTFLALLRQFQDSADFQGLALSTRREYARHIEKSIEPEFGELPISALTDCRARAEFLAWRDRIALKGKRHADYAFSVLARALSWAFNRGLAPCNPCERAGRLYKANRAEKVWSESDEAAFNRSAPEHLRLALIMALWTGQREGDLLRLPWSAYDEERQEIRLQQSKTGVRVTVHVGEALRDALAATKRVSPIILTNSSGRPWTSDGFKTSWAKACKAAGVKGVTFNDLRGTAISRLALAGATEIEIATVTGHSTKAVRTILDKHYLNRDPQMAKAAIQKLEKRTNFSN